MNDLKNYVKRFITAKLRNHTQGSISLMQNQIYNNNNQIEVNWKTTRNGKPFSVVFNPKTIWIPLRNFKLKNK